MKKIAFVFFITTLVVLFMFTFFESKQPYTDFKIFNITTQSETFHENMNNKISSNLSISKARIEKIDDAYVLKIVSNNNIDEFEVTVDNHCYYSEKLFPYNFSLFDNQCIINITKPPIFLSPLYFGKSSWDEVFGRIRNGDNNYTISKEYNEIIPINADYIESEPYSNSIHFTVTQTLSIKDDIFTIHSHSDGTLELVYSLKNSNDEMINVSMTGNVIREYELSTNVQNPLYPLSITIDLYQEYVINHDINNKTFLLQKIELSG